MPRNQSWGPTWQKLPATRCCITLHWIVFNLASLSLNHVDQAHAHMCAGYYKMLVGLRSEGKTVEPNPQFDNEPVRYEHRSGILCSTRFLILQQFLPRFGAFAALLTPPLMPYSQYKVNWPMAQNPKFRNSFKHKVQLVHFRKCWSTQNGLQWQHCTPLHPRTLVRPDRSSKPCRWWKLKLISNSRCQFQATVPDDEVASLITINKTNFVVASVLARDSKRNIDFDFSLHQNFPTAKLV